VPTVDTSNPFVVREVPLPEESFVVIRLSDAGHLNVPYRVGRIDNSLVSRPDTIVVPGTKMEFAMQLILTPMIRELVSEARKAGAWPFIAFIIRNRNRTRYRIPIPHVVCGRPQSAAARSSHASPPVGSDSRRSR